MAIKRMTPDEWRAQGEELFGPKMLEWRFKCPICGHVQSAQDFHKYKDQGANPSSAYQECLGRYLPKGESRQALGAGGKVEQPCDYAAYGLFNLCPVLVVDEDHETKCFGFDGATYGDNLKPVVASS